MPWTTPGTAVAGDVLTAARWNTDVRDNTNSIYSAVRRLDYKTRTTSYTVDQTTVASAADVFASDVSFTADGTSAYRVEFFCPFYASATTVDSYMFAYLVNGAGTALGVMAITANVQVSGKRQYGSISSTYYYTPAAGTTTLNIRGTYDTGNLNGHAWYGSTGGSTSGSYIPMFLAVYGPDLT